MKRDGSGKRRMSNTTILLIVFWIIYIVLVIFFRLYIFGKFSFTAPYYSEMSDLLKECVFIYIAFALPIIDTAARYISGWEDVNIWIVIWNYFLGMILTSVIASLSSVWPSMSLYAIIMFVCGIMFYYSVSKITKGEHRVLNDTKGLHNKMYLGLPIAMVILMVISIYQINQLASVSSPSENNQSALILGSSSIFYLGTIWKVKSKNKVKFDVNNIELIQSCQRDNTLKMCKEYNKYCAKNPDDKICKPE